MGVNLRDIAEPKRISLEDLTTKKLAIDAFNTLYQFLSIIRGESGDLLKDRKGNVTNHCLFLLPEPLAREQVQLLQA